MITILLIVLLFAIPSACQSMKAKKEKENAARIRKEITAAKIAQAQEKQAERQKAAAEKLRQAEIKRRQQLEKENQRHKMQAEKERQQKLSFFFGGDSRIDVLTMLPH